MYYIKLFLSFHGIYSPITIVISYKEKENKFLQPTSGFYSVYITFLYCFAVFFVGFLTSSSVPRLSRGPAPRLTPDNFKCCLPEAERGDHNLCLSLSLWNHIENDPTRWKRARERTHDILTRSCAPHRQTPPPPPHTHTFGTYQVWIDRRRLILSS